MRIRFIAPDPRAGAEAQMDSKRGDELIAAGCAVQINESGVEMPAAVMPARTALAIEMAAALGAALEALPGEYTEAEYAVRGLRREFGALFTAEDEVLVRQLVPAVNASPADQPDVGPAGDAGAGADSQTSAPPAAAPAPAAPVLNAAPPAPAPAPAAAPAAAETTRGGRGRSANKPVGE